MFLNLASNHWKEFCILILEFDCIYHINSQSKESIICVWIEMDKLCAESLGESRVFLLLFYMNSKL